MNLILSFDGSTSAAPSGFTTALEAAASYLDGLITNTITVTISVGWGEVNGSALPANALAEGGAVMTTESYSTVRSDLYKNSTLDAANRNLPATDPTNGAGVQVSYAQAQAWGLLSANNSGTEGVVGFSSNYSYDFSTTGAVPSGQYDFYGIALHELTHALGRMSSFGTTLPSPTVLDLFRYTSANTLATSASQSAYFSTNGGVTSLAAFSTSSDLADWASGSAADSFDAYSGTGQRYPLSTTDINLLNAIGFSTAANCFAAGTRIATPAGERAVESVRPGDLVRLADGGTAEVLWVGRQAIAACFVDPLRVWPVRIRAGALGPDVPRRDLLLSPGHAVRVGDVLAQAATLVNGHSIRRERQVPERFTYWHIELASHALLLAEGAAAESYLHTAAEFAFDNTVERAAGIVMSEELPYPRCKSPRQLPPSVRALLAGRAAALADGRHAA